MEEAHRLKADLLEPEPGDEPNALYLSSWDVPTRRAVWRTLRSVNGLSPFSRQSLPEELRRGTFGPDFEV